MRDGSSKLAHDRSKTEEASHSAQVLQFRPRPGDRFVPEPLHLPVEATDPEGEMGEDLAGREHDEEEPENINYPQRTLMNVIAAIVITMLIGLGVWLAGAIAEMERAQDCVLQGRQNCAPIEVAAPMQR
jgi:hypothetical protein